jgi:K+-transporting ATPase KdpF subunit
VVLGCRSRHSRRVGTVGEAGIVVDARFALSVSGAVMDWIYSVSGLVVALLAIYLVCVLARPERF